MEIIVNIAYTTISNPSVSISGWTYGETAKTPTPGVPDYAKNYVTYKYSGTTNANKTYDSTNPPTDAGTYTVIMTVGTDSYGNWSTTTAETSFTISRATPIISCNPETASDNLYYENLVNILENAIVNISGKDYTYDQISSYGTLRFSNDTNYNVYDESTKTYKLKFNTSDPANSSYQIEFVPHDTNNYDSAILTDTSLPLEIVAVLNPVISSTASTYNEKGVLASLGSYTADLTDFSNDAVPYGTIANALAATSSGNTATVWVVPNKSGNVVIDTDVEIKPGVTLILPYVTNGVVSKSVVEPNQAICFVSEGANLASSGDDTYCSTKVVVNPGVTITVSGTMEIAGMIYGGNGGVAFCGQTGGNYASLVLREGSKVDIKSGAVVKVTGYIVDEKDHDSSLVTNDYVQSVVNVESGATLYQPMVVRDFKGGNISSQIYFSLSRRAASPFNEFAFMNIESKIKISHGGKINNYANIAAGGSLNTALANIVGDTSDYFIELASGSYLEIDYDYSTNILNMHFFGGAKTNVFTITLNVDGKDYSCNSTEFVFPLSWMNDITLDKLPNSSSASYTMGGKFKMLSGSKMTVAEGVTLNVTELSVYNTMSSLGGVRPYPANYSERETSLTGSIPAAKLTVNGSLIATKLAGNVYTNNANGALITVTNTSITTNEAYSKSTFLGNVVTYKSVTLSTLNLYNSTSGSVKASTSSTYKTVNGTWTKQ